MAPGFPGLAACKMLSAARKCCFGEFGESGEAVKFPEGNPLKLLDNLRNIVILHRSAFPEAKRLKLQHKIRFRGILLRGTVTLGQIGDKWAGACFSYKFSLKGCTPRSPFPETSLLKFFIYIFPWLSLGELARGTGRICIPRVPRSQAVENIRLFYRPLKLLHKIFGRLLCSQV